MPIQRLTRVEIYQFRICLTRHLKTLPNGMGRIYKGQWRQILEPLSIRLIKGVVRIVTTAPVLRIGAVLPRWIFI